MGETLPTTDRGRPAAALNSPEEPADLEDALALARYRAEKAAGTLTLIPHDEVRARLGLERA
ncbi:type II toxin-antitoxin system prevent-host-death family antitoxin [Streptomyces sp. NPDC052396]|uniref:type II toxin-antitoxin system prevent-host-death family antitoxin n=1 Tax=Streptomyces sp. NPDC052396 TaxID=3365689 RepID=UPI0037D65D77